jgi:hypothetical protein
MEILRSTLAVATGGIVLLPMVVTVLVGLASLLRGFGDAAGGAWCLRAASVAGAGWGVAIAVAAAVCGAMLLAVLPERPAPRGDRSVGDERGHGS